MLNEDLIMAIQEYKDWIKKSKQLMSRYRLIRGLDSSQRERYNTKYHTLSMCENKLNEMLKMFEVDSQFN